MGMKKLLHILSWTSGTVAALLMLFGCIHFFFTPAAFLGVNHAVNFFHVANSFLLLAICIQLYLRNRQTAS